MAGVWVLIFFTLFWVLIWNFDKIVLLFIRKWGIEDWRKNHETCFFLCLKGSKCGLSWMDVYNIRGCEPSYCKRYTKIGNSCDNLVGRIKLERRRLELD